MLGKTRNMWRQSKLQNSVGQAAGGTWQSRRGIACGRGLNTVSRRENTAQACGEMGIMARKQRGTQYREHARSRKNWGRRVPTALIVNVNGRG